MRFFIARIQKAVRLASGRLLKIRHIPAILVIGKDFFEQFKHQTKTFRHFENSPQNTRTACWGRYG